MIMMMITSLFLLISVRNEIMRFVVLCISFIAIIGSSGVQATVCDENYNVNAEHKLKESLLCNYDPSIRPVKNRNEKITVALHFDMRHADFDEKTNRLETQMMIGMVWDDAFLRWNYKDVNITHLHLPAHDVWVPDLTVYNKFVYFMKGSWESWGSISLEGQNVFVLCTGAIAYYNIIDLSSQCTLDVTNWPYDVNVCTMSLSSGTYFSHALQFTLLTNWSFALGKNYFRSKVWDVVGVKGGIKETYHGKNATYRLDTIHLDVTIARESASLFSTVTTPILVIVLTLLATFWIDPFEMYRTLFGVASMIGHIAILLYLGKAVPPNGNRPVLIVSLIRNSLVLCWGSLIVHAYERVMCQSGKRPPQWMTNVSTWLRRYGVSVCFSVPQEVEEIEAEQRPGEIKAGKALEWLQISAIIDRSCFMIYFFIYLVMLIEFNYHLHQ